MKSKAGFKTNIDLTFPIGVANVCAETSDSFCGLFPNYEAGYVTELNISAGQSNHANSNGCSTHHAFR